MATKTRWMTAGTLVVLLVLTGMLPAAAHRGLPPAAPLGPQPATPSAWGFGAPVPTAGWLMGGASIDSCMFYAIGGNIAGGHTVTNVDLYSPLNDTWTPRASLPAAVYGIQATAYATRIYVVGGYPDTINPSYAITATQIYDSITNTWLNGAPIPVGPDGIGTAAQAAFNGKIYVIGGDDGDANSNSTNYEYDIATNAWTLRAPMPTARENNVAVTLNGKIYVAGGALGSDPNYTAMDTFEVYDPVANTWATLAPMQDARVSPGIATDGTYVYVFGGTTALAGSFSSLATAERYDPATNTWSYVDPMLQSAGGMAAAYAAGRLYSAGGLTATSGTFTRIQINQYLAVGANGCTPTAVGLADFAGADAPAPNGPLWLLVLPALGIGWFVVRRRAWGR